MTQKEKVICFSLDLSWNLLEDGAGQPELGLWGLELMIVMSGIKNTSRNVLFQIFNKHRQIISVFGSDRSPRRGDFVRPSVTFLKITVKMSSSIILMSPWGSSRQAGRQASTRKAFSRSHALEGLVEHKVRSNAANNVGDSCEEEIFLEQNVLL